MAHSTPYRISVPDESIERLRQKLALTTFPDELSDAQWKLGSPLADVKRLAEKWQTFDWRLAESKLNQLPQFKTFIDVDGFGDVGIHYIYQKSGTNGAIPLLFCHGWPGSYIEVTKLLPLLRDNLDGPAFDIIAPSLPNFGWSDGVKKTGFALAQYAEVCHKLMLKLGYTEYVTQGGDWGMYITRMMGYLFPVHCLASHINMVRGLPPTYRKHPLLALQHNFTAYTEKEKKGLARQQWFLKEGSGYRAEQSTKPQTLGYSLQDSPVGLLAWIYEKLHDWTDGYPWTDEEILTWISIYWFSSAGPAASLRIYYEAVHVPDPKINRDALSQYIPTVKLGLAYFPKELGVTPKTWGRTLGPVVFESEHDQGGHFAAWERPESIAHDLKNMFGQNGPCAAIVKGRSGFGRGPAKL